MTFGRALLAATVLTMAGCSAAAPPAAVPVLVPEVVAEMDAVSRRRQGGLALQLDRRLFVEPPAAGERVV
ncbi:MAG: hypothetical protein L0I24_12740, partial [Pseudonocardia sp.]|nr:hypothetical protein [Pseudonocardia sp.]